MNLPHCLRIQLYWRPNPATFNSLFKDCTGIVTGDYLVDNMPTGPALSVDSFIAVSASSPAQYVISFGKKQWIPDPATVSRFNFHAPVTIPHLALDCIPTGPNITDIFGFGTYPALVRFGGRGVALRH